MSDWRIKVQTERIPEIVSTWSKVKIDNNFGYAANFDKKVSCFIDLSGKVYIMGCRKPPSNRVVDKYLNLLYDNGLICCDNNPFPEFETRLPFEIDNTVIEIGGKLGE